MPLTRLDHANVVTANLAEMVKFYEEVLGMESGWRPNFPFGGAWMYVEGFPIVHLVDDANPPKQPGPIEHFAIAATDMDGFRANLEAHGVEYSVDPVPGIDLTQLNFRDPDGNHIHVDFKVKTEVAAS